MLFVAIIQFIAAGFTITALVKNTLMLSPEEHGVTCNITSPFVPKKKITAQHLVVYWGWETLEVRWDFEGLTNTQIWIKETYEKTYNYRCKTTSNTTKSPITSLNDSKCDYYYKNINNIEIPLPMRNTKYYPFELTNIYYNENEYNINNSTNNKEGCDDLQIVIETGKSYFSLLVCGLLFECIGLILLIFPTCHLINVSTRRLFKQIVIGLNTVSFMLLLMAFAIWFAYFSTNINQTLEQKSGNTFSVCILGEPIFGDSIAYLLSGWLLIGLATMSTCYLSNRPIKWYRFLTQKRYTNNNFNNKKQQLIGINMNENGTIIEESESETESTTASSDSSNNNNNEIITQETDAYTESYMKGDIYPYTYS